MGEVSRKLRSVDCNPGKGFMFWCPGCETAHLVRVEGTVKPAWNWDGNVESPSFDPSILVRVDWPPDSGGLSVCHSFVKAGQIQFLSDCTHKLAGRTVPIPDWPKSED